MSDEEKKAIEMLDKYITEHKLFNIKQADNLEDNIQIILNLIEKQSKEIEELKEVKWYYEISRVPKDKIKAKIEELEKGNKNTFIRGEKILVLQSLLEKE